jgi:hypothetical protein
MHRASTRSRRPATVAGIGSVNCERILRSPVSRSSNKTLANWRILAFIIIMRYTQRSQNYIILGMLIRAVGYNAVGYHSTCWLVPGVPLHGAMCLSRTPHCAAVGR